jgi:hypothetical protein
MPPLRFKKGDKVYAVNPREKVFKATIKATHPKTQPDLPYELDLATSMRHYPENGVFATRQEAEQQLAKDNLVKVEKALDQHGAMKMVQAVVPNEDGSYTGTGGEIIRPDFELSDKDLEELQALAKQLDMWLAAHNVPYMMCIVTSKKDGDDNQNVGLRRTACFPGPRTPDWLRGFYSLLEGFISYVGKDQSE